MWGCLKDFTYIMRILTVMKERDCLDRTYLITQVRVVVCAYIFQAMAFSNKQSNLVEKSDLSPLTTKLQQT